MRCSGYPAGPGDSRRPLDRHPVGLRSDGRVVRCGERIDGIRLNTLASSNRYM